MTETDNTYTAFTLTDDSYGTPGIAVEDDEGRLVDSSEVSWPDGEWDADLADAMLDRMGFDRTSSWQWQSPQWVALVANRDPATPEGVYRR